MKKMSDSLFNLKLFNLKLLLYKVGKILIFSPQISMHLYSVYSNPKVIKDMTLKIYVIARSNVP